MKYKYLLLVALTLSIVGCRIPFEKKQLSELCFDKSNLNDYKYENVDGCGNAILFKLINAKEILVVRIDSDFPINECKEFTNFSSEIVEVELYQYPIKDFPVGIEYFPLCTDIEIVKENSPHIFRANSFRLLASKKIVTTSEQILCTILLKECTFNVLGEQKYLKEQYFHEVEIGKLSG